MRPRQTGPAMLALMVLSCIMSGCSSTSSNSRTSSSASGPSKTWLVEALGDSVPHGTNCDCTPYPSLSAQGLTASTAQNVSATNDAEGGFTTSSVLKELQSDRKVTKRVRRADVVEIEVGANDVGYSDSCGTAVACYEQRFPTIENNLKQIVARVHELTSGHKVLVVLLDYWSVWLGGQYAAAQGDVYVDAAARVTDGVNAIIKSTAASSGSAYIDLRAAFKGPSYTYDETHYLSNDGDHPNKAGHQKIATATQAVIEKTLHI